MLEISSCRRTADRSTGRYLYIDTVARVKGVLWVMLRS